MPRTSDRRADAGFGERYAVTYRVAFRLTGDATRSSEITRSSLARADAGVVPRSERVRTARACRFAADDALREDVLPGIVAAAEERRKLRAAVRSLPAQQRAVFVLEALAGLSQDDVAVALGLSGDWLGSQSRVSHRTVQERMNAVEVQPAKPGHVLSLRTLIGTAAVAGPGEAP
jgi:DNA-directed RNA polymerase specialized sigma24 family protein